MKKKIIIIFLILIIFIIIMFLLKILVYRNNDNETTNLTIGELKQEIGITGEDELYNVTTDDTGQQVLYLKDDIKFKVALAGMLENKEPEKNKVDEIINEFEFNKEGIFVEQKSREKFINLIEDYTNNKYRIDENGFLYVENKYESNENDIILENTINSNKLYIIQITDKCYTLDDVTGQVIDYPFENMDPYQVYQLYSYDKSNIIFITTNSKDMLTADDIFEEIINIF